VYARCRMRLLRRSCSPLPAQLLLPHSITCCW
jgi:hypothetical protein